MLRFSKPPLRVFAALVFIAEATEVRYGPFADIGRWGIRRARTYGFGALEQRDCR
jgi:hypothetical protein